MACRKTGENWKIPIYPPKFDILFLNVAEVVQKSTFRFWRVENPTRVENVKWNCWCLKRTCGWAVTISQQHWWVWNHLRNGYKQSSPTATGSPPCSQLSEFALEIWWPDTRLEFMFELRPTYHSQTWTCHRYAPLRAVTPGSNLVCFSLSLGSCVFMGWTDVCSVDYEESNCWWSFFSSFIDFLWNLFLFSIIGNL